MCAMYHTHSGLRQIGAPIWDLWYVMKDMDPRWVGINYDIGHATVEGGFGGWIDSARLVRKHMRGVALKDFKWGQNARGAWAPQWCAAGEGMVNFAGFFEILKTQKFSGPVQLHFEYPGLGGADGGKAEAGDPERKAGGADAQGPGARQEADAPGAVGVACLAAARSTLCGSGCRPYSRLPSFIPPRRRALRSWRSRSTMTQPARPRPFASACWMRKATRLVPTAPPRLPIRPFPFRSRPSL